MESDINGTLDGGNIQEYCNLGIYVCVIPTSKSFLFNFSFTNYINYPKANDVIDRS